MGAKQAAVAALACVLAAACGGGAPQGAPSEVGSPESDVGSPERGRPPDSVREVTLSGEEVRLQREEVTLSGEEVTRLGIHLTPATAVTYSPGPEGFGTVVSHDTIAQLAADLQIAKATTQQSDSALQRARHLAGGPGSLGLEAVEVATRQAASDRAALQLARRKLTATLGAGFPDAARGPTNTLEWLASGEWKLVRVTFPAGALDADPPLSVRLTRVDVGVSSPTTWEASGVWAAPADPMLPGSSFFALVKRSTLPEGSRLRANAVFRQATAGVLIPESGVVVSNGQSWCFVQRAPDKFARVPLDLSRPLPGGYFMSSGISAGQQIVTTAAGLLLARQLSPATQRQGED